MGFLQQRLIRRGLKAAPTARVRHPSPTAFARQHGREGFTLLELMVAMMFMSVGILAMAQVFRVAERHTGHARMETTAVALSQEIREKIMSESYADIASIFDGIDTDDPGSVPLPAQEWAAHLAAELGASGRGTIEVTTGADDPSLGTGLLDVLITMSWREGDRPISLPLRFLVAKIGV